MEKVKKILCFFALCLSLIGGVWAMVSVIQAADSAIPVIGLALVILAAVPTWVYLFKKLV